MTLKVAVLDDHRAFGEAVSMALISCGDICSVGVVNTIDQLMMLARRQVPDVVLVDYQLSGETGIDCAKRFEEEGIEARLILLTAHASSDVATRALSNGFERVLSKESPLNTILKAVRRAPSVGGVSAPRTKTLHFSRRQREVLELMGQGLDPASIADKLYISVHTARSHVKDVLRTLGAPTQLAAVTTAIREGYLLPPSKDDGPT